MEFWSKEVFFTHKETFTIMSHTYLIITSIADQYHQILKQFAKECKEKNIFYIVIGDSKSPTDFNIEGCDYYSIEHQLKLDFELAKKLPLNHYARKNIGYLIAISKGAQIIIETDDDNIPLKEFWNPRNKQVKAHLINNSDWVNVYKYFTSANIWPRGFALENIYRSIPALDAQQDIECPIQQGLADENPDVDAIYRLTNSLPVKFEFGNNIALGNNTICPFNSQNTTWFNEAFPLLYLPSYCSFRMTDIWRSFVAQRIAWSCGWSILFHQCSVKQERNEHNLMFDFKDEIVGYTNNLNICNSLKEMNLDEGIINIPNNMIQCYQKLVELGLVDTREIALLKAWLKDIKKD